MFILEPPEYIHGKKLKMWYRRVMADGGLPANWIGRPRVRVRSEKALVEALNRLYSRSQKYVNRDGWIVRRNPNV